MRVRQAWTGVREERERKSLKLFHESGEMIFIMRHLGVTKKHSELTAFKTRKKIIVTFCPTL